MDFSEDNLRAAVKAYDPALHEAPIVVGHPKDNHPAYGWIKSLEFDEGTGEIIAIPQQVDSDFAEMVDAGRFKKRSASWYLPDSPSNPKPGTLYLRHVGFLGAQPPAVKGLKPVEFKEGDKGVVEFGDFENRWAFTSIETALRSLREWIIGDKGIETADKVLPNYLISDIERAAQAPIVDNSTAIPSFSEGKNMKTATELQAELDAANAKIATLTAQVGQNANFAERAASLDTREAAIAAKEAKLSLAGIETRVDAAIAAGKVLKAQRASLVAFAASLADGEATFDFAEGDKTVKLSQREIYLRGIEGGPKVVEFGERGSGTGEPKGTPEKLAEAQHKLSSQVMG